MTKRSAVLIALTSPILAFVAVVFLTERISFDPVPPGKSRRAAIAIRDDVTPFQKWGTKQLTAPYLDRYYDTAWYFTQSKSDHCKQAFIESLDSACQRYPEVDLYLLAHSNHFVQWVAELPAERRAHLRLVYNTGCCDLPQGSAWLNLGAKAYIGHPGESDSPYFYFFFLRRWVRGASLQAALDDSNALMRTTVRRAEFISFGKLNAAQIIKNSEASSYGNTDLRITGE